MRRLLITLAVIAFVLALPLVGTVGYLMGHRDSIYLGGRATTVSRLSPDETILARLIEVSLTQSLGRRFKVQLDSSQSGIKDIYLSAEEEEAGQPGSERLIWSKDGTKLLLVGRHFFVKEDLFLDNGDQLFFLYDIPTNRGWCNAANTTADFLRLKAEAIEGIEFTEPIKLKAR